MSEEKKTEDKTGEEKEYCYKYPHPAVTTDCVIFGFDGEQLKILLIERGIDPFQGKWALPGGFINETETVEQCARRELREETGLDAEFLEQLHCYSDPKRDERERVITIAFMGLVKLSEVTGGDDAAAARWFPLDEIPPLAFDHDKIVRDATYKLREQIHFRPIGFDLLPREFSAPQLQGLYESILGVKFDRRNFSKKMKHLELLLPVEETGDQETARRKPLLYTFNLEKYKELKQRGFRLEF